MDRTKATEAPLAGAWPADHDITRAVIAASAGDTYARVALSSELQRDVSATTFARSLNAMLDQVASRAAAQQQRIDELAGTLDSMRDGVIAADPEGRVTRMNPVAVELTGWTELAARGRSLVDVFHIIDPTTRTRMESPVERVLREGVVIGMANHTLLLSRDGTERSIADSGTPIRGADGLVRGVVLVFKDMTEERKVEAELRAGEVRVLEHLRSVQSSEAKLRGLLEALPDAVLIFDEMGSIVVVNARTETLFGRSREALVGSSIDALIPDRFGMRTSERRMVDLAKISTPPSGSGLEMCGRRKDGTEFPIEVSWSPIETAAGVLVSSVVRDVTDRRRADEQRLRLAQIVESSTDAIIGKGLDGLITSWNEGAHQMFGYSSSEMLGKPISVLFPLESTEDESELLRQLTKGEHVRSFDTVRRKKDGTEIAVSVAISPVRDGSGVVVGASKVARDISERVRSEAALAHAKDAAEYANRELEAFSYAVAHDLRAPLRGMNGFAQLLLDSYRAKLDPEAQDWLQEIVLNAKKMGALIDSLLSLSRVARSEAELVLVDLSAVARASAAELRAAEPTRTVELTIADGLVATMDPTLARALLDNLFGNAWKFTSKVPIARIEFGSSQDEGRQVFFVRDNGAGFDMAFAGKLFRPFQRLHTGSEFAGTGIGLATVERIVHRHGGTVWAEGAVDVGATLYFRVSDSAMGAK